MKAVKNNREEKENKRLKGLIVFIVVIIVFYVAVDPKSMMATDKAWCGTTTEENQAPLDELVLLPGGNNVTFFGGRYYAEFNPQVSNELECSIDVMFRTHGQITGIDQTVFTIPSINPNKNIIRSCKKSREM